MRFFSRFLGHFLRTQPEAESAEPQRTVTDNGEEAFIFALTLSQCICAILIDFQL